MSNIRKILNNGKKVELPIWNGKTPYALYYNGECVWKNGETLAEFIFYCTFTQGQTVTIPKIEDDNAYHEGYIKWGDGKKTSVYYSNQSYSHTYSEAGDYVLKIYCNIETIAYGGDGFFYLPYFNFYRINEIIFPETLKTISYKAFTNHENLQSIQLKNVDKIEAYAFRGCTNLQSVISNKITYIADHAFELCKNLTDVNITTEPVGIGYNSFWSCTNLKNINIENAKYISRECFYDCDNIQQVSIGHITIARYRSINNTTGENRVINIESAIAFETKAFEGFIISKIPDNLIYAGLCKQYQSNVGTGKSSANDLILKGNCYMYGNIVSNTYENATHIQIPDGATGITLIKDCVESISFVDTIKYINYSPLEKTVFFQQYLINHSSDEFIIFGTALVKCQSTNDVIVVPDDVTSISEFAFEKLTASKIVLNNKILLIDRIGGLNGRDTFNTDSLKTIEYKGTIQEWYNIVTTDGWRTPGSNVKIVCTDGEI